MTQQPVKCRVIVSLQRSYSSGIKRTPGSPPNTMPWVLLSSSPAWGRGNIPKLETPASIQLMGSDGEGYGICNESPAQNYSDYGVRDSGNGLAAVVPSTTAGSVKIARTTEDGHWTLTQTITKVAKTPSITVVMALKNNQAADHVAYLVRFAHANPPGIGLSKRALAGFNGAVNLNDSGAQSAYGLILQNAAKPPFGYWQAFVQTVTTGPNACAFAFNGGVYGSDYSTSMEVVYVGTVKAGQTNTVTMTYRGL